MYSGTTFRLKSGRVMGVHQRIDRAARRQLSLVLPRGVYFPSIRDILHFEGKHGPDGVKRKSPAVDEPWHYINPEDPTDLKLIEMIEEHIHNLAVALKSANQERAAFEAAWMAHAITDGLTPAHHYPLEAKLEELRGGQGIETRTTTKEKIFLPGKDKREMIKNNWEYWGAKGVMTTHFSFELGVASTLSTANLTKTPHRFCQKDSQLVREKGFRAVFKESLESIHTLGMYEEFHKKGWTRHLANLTTKELTPQIVRTVCMGWYAAIAMAEAAQDGQCTHES
jgi:hypothetical protein